MRKRHAELREPVSQVEKLKEQELERKAKELEMIKSYSSYRHTYIPPEEKFFPPFPPLKYQLRRRKSIDSPPDFKGEKRTTHPEQPQPKAETKTEPRDKTKTKPTAKTKTEPSAETKTDPTAETKTEIAVKTKTKPTAETKTQPAVSDPSSETKSKPTAES
ncbi:neurofilament heavy polypeptide-like isoform X1 [Astyanax mexicanus]|uniref:Neurofilament heavy polypeptide-like isoform X1 n=1 Tax=Astyanax mexicanus TaxID=7994 RepID=A0A8T2M7B8_ASTMX|nr:neurofilament heavy polypeptide-like isoform X1 [Astyanax mexicanus]